MLGAMVLAGTANIIVWLRENMTTITLSILFIGIAFVHLYDKAKPSHLAGEGCTRGIRTNLLTAGALGVGAQSVGVLLAGSLAQNVFEPLM